MLLVAATATSSSSSSTSSTSGPNETSSATASRSPARVTAKCLARAPQLRAGVRDRRSAAWRWQDAVDVPRTRSAFRERSTRSCDYLRWIRSTWSGRADDSWRFYVELRDDPLAAIRHVFGVYADEAIAVSWCESKHDVTAGVGKHQYLGLFQMGSSERDIYGHGWTALEQARAAWLYFVRSGRDWSPWSCGWAAR